MKNIKFVYKLSVGLVIAVFLLIAISDMAGNYSKNYKVQIIGGELSSSDSIKWLINHPRVWSVGYVIRLEKYNLPYISPTYLVEKVKTNILSRRYYIELIYSTNDLEDLKRFLD